MADAEIDIYGDLLVPAAAPSEPAAHAEPVVKAPRVSEGRVWKKEETPSFFSASSPSLSRKTAAPAPTSMAAAAAAAADAQWAETETGGGVGSRRHALAPSTRPAAGPLPDEELVFETTGDGSGTQTWVNPAFENLARDAPKMEGGEFAVEKSKFAETDQAEDFEALRQELMEEELVGPSKKLSFDDPLVEDGSDTDESSDEIELGEVRGSDVPVRRPRYFPNRTLGGSKVSPQNPPARMPWQSPSKTRSAGPPEGKGGATPGGPEASVPSAISATAATPAPTADTTSMALALQAHDSNKFLLLGGLPVSLSKQRLWELSEEFGKVNRLRMLDDVDDPKKSTGIALVEFHSTESAARAADPRSGYRMQNEWLVTFVPPPKVALVSRELLGMMFAGAPPWPEGGYCSEDLRAVLLRQFELWELGTNRPGEGSRSALSRRDSNSSLSRANQGFRPAEDWKSKLRALKRSVNSRQDMDGVKRRRL